MTKARTLADFISDGSPLADGTISVAEVSGAAPLANPTFTGTASGTFSGPLTGNVTGDVTGDVAGELDLSPIASTIADTAVDVFVYDTSKDSDGGAWRKRTQGTSWYNETLNTATRGSRKEFPAVAVIVAETYVVNIYDGDDPALPLWRSFDIRDYDFYAASNTGVAALNGMVVVSNTGNIHRSNIRQFDFIKDRYVGLRDETYANSHYIAEPLTSTDFITSSSLGGGLVSNGYANDVAMTVLPNAPIDAATGLPVPTIAVATNGGVSVIKDDGTVVDITTTNVAYNNVPNLSFRDDGKLSHVWSYTSNDVSARYVTVTDIPSADYSIGDSQSYSSAKDEFYADELIASRQLTITIDRAVAAIKHSNHGKAFGQSHGVALLYPVQSKPDTGSVAYVASTYNTGWMNGDIKLATLSDTDDTDAVGSELVTNGTFDTDVSGWTAANGAALAVVSGELQLTANGTSNPLAKQTITTVVGKEYVISATARRGTCAASVKVDISGISGAGITSSTTNTTISQTFIATSTSHLAEVYIGGSTSNGETAFFDNVSVRLAEEDRSVNGNGLQVFGTVTKNPVATGADLVGYTFSGNGTDYLQQPYNSDFNVGTGDFTFSFWFNVNTSAAKNIFELGGPTEGSTAAHCLLVQMQTTGVLRLYIRNSSNNAWIAPQLDSASVNDGSWHCVSLVRNSGTVQWFVDGVAGNSDSTAFTSSNLGSTNALLRLGRGIFSANNAFNGSLALWRISATAPSAEQIAKIYNDEKHLFQENAQATLYGSSDAVTALAYDDTTELLHVGTSGGRSVFQGLRRVNNTTNAVGAAISASNGMIVEE